jgi:hypothetical protein
VLVEGLGDLIDIIVVDSKYWDSVLPFGDLWFVSDFSGTDEALEGANLAAEYNCLMGSVNDQSFDNGLPHAASSSNDCYDNHIVICYLKY